MGTKRLEKNDHRHLWGHFSILAGKYITTRDQQSTPNFDPDSDSAGVGVVTGIKE